MTGTRTASPRAAVTVARPWAVPAALAVVYVVWGSTYLAIKVAIASVPPLTMAAVRFALAGTVLYLWAVRRGDRVGDRPTWRQWRSAFVVGGLLLVGGNGAVILAELRLDSGTAALLVATVPLWMALLAWRLAGERLAAWGVVGLVLGFGGVAVLADPGGGSLHLPSALLVVVGTLLWAYGSLVSRDADLPRRPLVAAAMEMLAASALFAVLGAARGEWAALDPGDITLSSALAVLYLATAGSILAFSAYVWLLRSAPASLVATYAYVNPVVAVLLGWAVLGEVVTLRTFAAGGVILVAVALIVQARARPVPAQPTSGGDAMRALADGDAPARVGEVRRTADG